MKKKRIVCISVNILIIILLLCLFVGNAVCIVSVKKYKETEERKTEKINQIFRICLAELKPEESFLQQKDGEAIFIKYVQAAERLDCASQLVTETSYHEYETMKNGQSEHLFSNTLRYVALHLKEHVEEGKRMESDEVEKMQTLLLNIENNLDNRENCLKSVTELKEWIERLWTHLT